MRRDLTIKSGDMAGTSDFTVVASIKRGFVPSLDAMTYKTRVKRVLRTLHSGRLGAHENELARVLSDAVERVGRIHSVGIVVLEPEDKVLLKVTFDGSWEAYVRVIWQKVARLLDLIFWNTEGYVLGYENSYEDWCSWLRQAQTEAPFLYATPGLTVDDVRYLQMAERVHRREAGDAADLRATGIKIPTAEEIARQSIFGSDDLIGIDPTNAGYGQELTIEAAGRPPFRHAIRSLVGLYRLADMYRPGTEDGRILHRAAHELLPELVRMMNDGNTYGEGIGRALRRFDEAVRWLQTSPDIPEVRQGLPLALPSKPPLKDAGNVQGGILRGYPHGDHGCALLVQFASPAALAAFLKVLPVTSEADVDALKPGQIATNIALTVEGLRVAGLSDAEIRSLPEEFAQGMERRAGLLGDVRWNHPRRWRLPARNWDRGVDAADIREDDPAPRIDLSAVHAIVQCRILAAGPGSTAESRELLMTEMRRWVEADAGVQPLSLQWMQRHRDRSGLAREHFGFLDGNSDPVLDKDQAGTRFPNHVHLGEILCGHPNLADKTGPFGDEGNRVHSLLRDGSFLVVRKLRQDVEALDGALDQATRPAPDAMAAGAPGPALTREELLAKMMGRWPTGHPNAGRPLTHAPPHDARFNDFSFDHDPSAELCPFHAHIRRVNPRTRITRADAGARPPRIARRGMSYGPPVNLNAASIQATRDSLREERGLIFMAYNASLGEQFEVVQRWLSGGNSSGSHSGQSDPFLGLAEPGRRRYFRFKHEGRTVRMALDGSDRLHDEPRPFVRLEWGAYFFAPSKRALESLQASAAAQGRQPLVAWSVEAGEKEIGRLRDIETRAGGGTAASAWKAALEDPDAAADFTTASIWAAIRERHGGVLRTPYGILVADRQMIEEVLADPRRCLTITAYLPRMRRSFGILYLGLDPEQEDRAYEHESEACNAAIMALDQQSTFTRARKSTHDALQRLVRQTIDDAKEDQEARWDLTVDARELVEPLLADFCEEWFGLSEDGGYFRRAGYRWDWKEGDRPNYPGHFLSPSRYIFQPHPGPEVEAIGSAHGAAVRRSMLGFLSRFGADVTAPVTRAVLDSERGKSDIAFSARAIAGAMMGFIPTVEGNLRRILHEWLREGTLWSLRTRYTGATEAASLAEAWKRLGDDFTPAMQLRAVPELIWRTATVSHTLGSGQHRLDVKPGDIVVAGAISATQQSLQEGRPELYHAFGGNRSVPGHPTHACPGANPALAVMLGFFSALVESPLPLRAGPGPLTIGLDGWLPPPCGAPPAAVALTGRMPIADDGSGMPVAKAQIPRVAHAFQIGAANVRLRLAKTPLVAIGDSWFHFAPGLVSSLEGYFAGKRFGSVGRRLEDMANADSLEELRNYFTDPGPNKPKALLMGGGGNDIVYGYWNDPRKSPLYLVLSPDAGDDPLIENKVHDFIDRKLASFYRKVIECIVVELKNHTDVPILIHGYDHPIPDGRGRFLAGPWLKPIFSARGISDGAVARDAMRRLIDRLNAMVAKVAGEFEVAHPGRVHAVNLTGRLAKDPRYQQDYKLLWADELHCTKLGFDLLAADVAAKLKAIGV